MAKKKSEKKNNILEKFNSKNIIIATCLLAIAIVFLFGVSEIMKSGEFHKDTIEYLKNKKIAVTEMSALSVGAATGIAMVPGDSTTPIANQIMDFTGYFVVIISVIVLEEILITLMGYLACKYVVPIALILIVINIFYSKELLIEIAKKMILLSLVMVFVIPISVDISRYVEEQYKPTFSQTIEQAKAIIAETENEEISENADDSVWDKVVQGISNAFKAVGETVSNIFEIGRLLINNLIDTIAIWLITSCVMPIIVLLIFIKFINKILDLSIPVKIPRMKMPHFKEKEIE